MLLPLALLVLVLVLGILLLEVLSAVASVPVLPASWRRRLVTTSWNSPRRSTTALNPAKDSNCAWQAM